MKLTSKHQDYTIEGNRVELAKRLSLMFGRSGPGIPYQPNEGDDTYWTLDAGNDWKLSFRQDQDGDSPEDFHITYRYQSKSNQYEEALFGWLQARWGIINSDERK